MGEWLIERMRDWPALHRIVGDVRGRGLMIGVEVVRDQKTKERGPELRDAVVSRAFGKGLLLLGAGENTIRVSPPLMIDQEQAEFAAGIWNYASGSKRSCRVGDSVWGGVEYRVVQHAGTSRGPCSDDRLGRPGAWRKTPRVFARRHSPRSRRTGVRSET
jgi:hypothetical protein